MWKACRRCSSTSGTRIPGSLAAVVTRTSHRRSLSSSTSYPTTTFIESQSPTTTTAWNTLPRHTQCTSFHFRSRTSSSVRSLSWARVLIDEEETSTSSSETTTTSSSKLIPTFSQPLGAPLPTDEHACSVSLPTWASVVGYEEGCPKVTGAMNCGYPRFVYHPYLKQVMAAVVQQYGTKDEECLLLPTPDAARRCQVFLQQAWEQQPQSREHDNALVQRDNDDTDNDSQSLHHPSRVRCVEVVPQLCYAVLFPAETQAAMAAKAYWQHTGEIVSSRRAYATLQQMQLDLSQTVTDEQHVHHPAHLDETDIENESKPKDDDDTTADPYVVQHQLRQRIAGWACPQTVTANHVYLTPSGMGAMYLALRSARRRHMEMETNSNGGTSIVYGFPYLDTLKLCSRPEFCPGGVQFFGKGDTTDLQQLEHWLQTQSSNNNNNAVSILFTEVPSNPLLHCPDLLNLRQLADEYNFVLAVDDTIANFCNVNLIESGLADVVCTSLTKLVSGRGDAMAGSCVVNPNTNAGQWMHQDLMQQQQAHLPSVSGLYCPDALAILRNSSDFCQRSAIVNQTSEQLADWLAAHPDVERVYYPKHNEASVELYRQVMSSTEEAGYGGLLSITLHSHVCQRTFYDALDVAKGPSLGTNFTLVCPYTLLAHYHELDFAMSYNVPPNLLRIAVGLEPLDELKEKFSSAFDSSRLYPKLETKTTTTSP